MDAPVTGNTAVSSALDTLSPLGLTQPALTALLRAINAAAPVGEADWMGLILANGAATAPQRLDRAQQAALRLLRQQVQAQEDQATAPHAAVRLAALRREMQALHLSVYVVPHDDAYLGEFLPPGAERLGWLTDFTGSAGFAVVPVDPQRKAALFVDGRYQVQARQQVEASLFDIRHSQTQTLEGWLAGQLKRGDVVGYDPWTHSEAWRQRLEKVCVREGWDLKPVPRNLIDKIWSHQPPPPLSPVRLHPERFAGQSSADKRAALAADLKAKGARAAVLAQSDSIAWLLNIRGADVPCTPVTLSYALVLSDGSVAWAVDPRKVSAEVRAGLDAGVKVHPETDMESMIRHLTPQRGAIQLDPARTPAQLALWVRRAGLEIQEAPDPCLAPRAQKTQAEIAGARRAHRRDGVALVQFMAWLDRTLAAGEAVTEISAAQQLHRCRSLQSGFRGDSFETISGHGDHGAIVHYRVTPASDRPLCPGTLYLVDSGGQYTDATTDVTRTIAIGRPSRAMIRDYTLVLKGHLAVARLHFPEQTTGAQIDGVARAPLWAAGLDYDHGTGHGVGSHLSVHEGPIGISRRHHQPLKPGMILSNEPGLYREGAYGIRIETLVLVVSAPARRGALHPMLRFETLTLAPYDRSLIDPALLSKEERAWVDAYHARVLRQLGPRLSEPDRRWLTAATLPLVG